MATPRGHPVSHDHVHDYAQGEGNAHSHSHGHTHDQGGLHQHFHTGETLAYRLSQWRELHFADSRMGQQHLANLQGLGCEARLDNPASGGATVTYRCVEWMPLELATHELAEQWADWLVASGFDCSHGHVDPVMLNGPEIVEFRLAEWQTTHMRREELMPFVESLERIGCEVQQMNDGDHVDVSFRSPLWRDIHLSNHQTAEKWVTFFETYSFEVRHAHD